MCWLHVWYNYIKGNVGKVDKGGDCGGQQSKLAKQVVERGKVHLLVGGHVECFLGHARHTKG
jgi:hypothetical protein